MAKTIKFNLICDNCAVRNLGDLREHFCIEDVLEYYHNGLLVRWLTVRGYEQELAAVSKLNSTDELQTAKELIRILGVETDGQAIEQAIYMLQYRAERKELFDRYTAQKCNAEQIVGDYYEGYEQLIRDVLYNNCNMTIIKAAIKEMNDNYFPLFSVDYRVLFELFYNLAPMAIFVMLTYPAMRARYLKEENLGSAQGALAVLDDYYDDDTILVDCDKAGYVYSWIDDGRDVIHSKIVNLTTNDSLHEILGDHLKTYQIEEGTQDYGFWRDVEVAQPPEKNKKYLILRMALGNSIVSVVDHTKEYSANEINGKFKILEGIQYKCSEPKHVLYYMEV